MTQMLIDYYKAIEDSSKKMVEAANAQNWEEVVRFEGACAVLIEQLRRRSTVEELSSELRHEKTKIMTRILINDAKIRNLAEPWVNYLEQRFERASITLH